MENDAPKSAEVDQKNKESRLAYTLLVLLLAAGGIGYGIYYWQSQRANRQAIIQLAESIELDSSGMAADKQARELVASRGWTLVDRWHEKSDPPFFYRTIKTSESPGKNDWVLHVVFEGMSTKGVFMRTEGSMTTRPTGAPEDRIADESKPWVQEFGG